MTSFANPASPAPLALVTGGSTGIGRELARVLVERDHDVVVVAQEPGIRDVASELCRSGRVVTAVQADLATPRGVQDLWDQVLAQSRPLSVAVLNAGVGVSGRFDRSSLESDLQLVDLNVRSTVHVAKLVVREMVARGEGRLLITSSIAGVAPGPYHATYAASKAFVHLFAQGIREELKDTGVSVTSLMPGPTETEFFSRAGMEDTKLGQMDDKDDPREVAEDGYEAMMSGKPSVVAGSLKNKVQAEVGTHLPDAVAAPVFARMAKPHRRSD